jgi:hypothetical protein
MNEYKIAFLVLSYDKYSDLWKPFAQLFDRYWPDCPFDKYFASNEKPFNEYGFQPVLMGEDKTWSMGLQTALSALKDRYEYVLITLEDLFLTNNVDNECLMRCVDEFLNKDGIYLRLYSLRKIHKADGQYIERIKHNIPYRHNCVYALWKIAILQNVLVSNENAWEFEKVGAKRTATMNGFFHANKKHFIFTNVIIKGKWRKEALIQIQNILPDIAINRQIFTDAEEKRFNIRLRAFKFFYDNVPFIIQKLLYKLGLL